MIGTVTVHTLAKAWRRPALQDLVGRRVLLVASTGGHLEQLTRLEPLLQVAPDSEWLTFDTPQSRSLLKGRRVTHVAYVAPRALGRILRAMPAALRRLREVEGVVSTGAGVALAAVPFAPLLGRPAVYIESVSRVDGPSVTGRILARLPWVGLYTQHASWAGGPWRLAPSVLSTFESEPLEGRRELRRLVVTVGTISPYRFDRLVDGVLAMLRRRPEVEVRWQLGETTRSDLPGEVRDYVSREEWEEWTEWADLVVTHAGVGSVLGLLDEGHYPLVEPRRPELGEHVDGHQMEISRYVWDRGLGAPALATLASDDLIDRALRRRVLPSPPVPVATSHGETPDTPGSVRLIA